ncbi:hypothetical protein AN926_00780 [Thermus scotoductus]|uniref:Transcriptional regulator n=1 Tax=Thermus scotoductus TaxID=37636 RepID=A0A0N1KQ01_THESC|nr:hypothetical protein AN926_00780 [Thermus scotoductus]
MGLVRDKRLEAHLLHLLREPRTLEDLHTQLQSLRPGLRKATLFALLVRLRREGKVAFCQGCFSARKEKDSDI